MSLKPFHFIPLQNWDQMCGQSLPAALHSSIQRKDFMEVRQQKQKPVYFRSAEVAEVHTCFTQVEIQMLFHSDCRQLWHHCVYIARKLMIAK